MLWSVQFLRNMVLQVKILVVVIQFLTLTLLLKSLSTSSTFVSLPILNLFLPFLPFSQHIVHFISALLCIQNDILLAMDEEKLGALVLLDLSAAFVTIDHDILLTRLSSYFGISGH